MTKEEIKILKKARLHSVLQLFWDSYEHMYNVRETNIQNRVNFLLIITSFFPVLCIALVSYSNNIFFLVPAFLSIVSLCILLKSFFIESYHIPWLKIPEDLVNLDNEDFELSLVAHLKTFENETWHKLERMQKIIFPALYILIASIYLLILTTIFELFSKWNALILAIILTLSLMGLFYYYFAIRKAFDFEKDLKENLKLLNAWLNNKK